jgi:enamine deaminase RidA (YjgF/YER057c/UK114 family)
MSRVAARLAELGLTLPEPARPVATYVPFRVVGREVWVSMQGSVGPDRRYLGKIGAGLTLEEGKEAARLAFLNVLAQLREAAGGDLDRITALIRLTGFIASTPEFTDHAQVMNGASDLAVAVLGEAGRHSRSTVGVAALPLDFAVGIDAVALLA